MHVDHRDFLRGVGNDKQMKGRILFLELEVPYTHLVKLPILIKKKLVEHLWLWSQHRVGKGES